MLIQFNLLFLYQNLVRNDTLDYERTPVGKYKLICFRPLKTTAITVQIVFLYHFY